MGTDFDNAGVEQILDHAADLIEEYCDLDAIIDAAQRLPTAYKAVAAMPGLKSPLLPAKGIQVQVVPSTLPVVRVLVAPGVPRHFLVGPPRLMLVSVAQCRLQVEVQFLQLVVM